MAARHGSADVHSLWLLPPPALRRRLARWIARLARRRGTEPFEPHLTLLGGISLPRGLAVERTAALARSLRPFPVRLSGPGHGPAFFRCVYLHAGGAAVRRARALAVQAIEGGAGGTGAGRRGSRRPGGRFRPHLSLVYGKLPAAERRQLAREIGRKLALTFTARRIALVRTSGDPRSWRVVAVRGASAESPAAPGPRPPGSCVRGGRG